MKIEYQRNLSTSYMMIRGLEMESNYEDKVLLQNKINYLLPVTFSHRDGEKECWFDITGQQTLDVFSSVYPIDDELMRNLFGSLCKMAFQLDNFFLDCDHLILKPETILIENSEKKLSFCYCPGQSEAVTEQIRHLVEYLLTKVDHKNEQAVKLVYEMYEITLQEEYSIQDMRKVLDNRIQKTELGQPDYQVVNLMEGEAEQETLNARSGVIEDLEQQMESEHSAPKKVLLVFAENIKEKVKEVFSNRKKVTTLQEQKRNNNTIIGRIVKKKEEIQPFVFEPEEENYMTNHPTVLLSERKQQIRGILVYEGNGVQKDMEITSTPFMIGSGTEHVDGVINSRAVSRHHARILREGDVFFLEDLNSTNGTKIGGENLNYKVRMSLQVNDRIQFADEIYRFS